MSDDFFPDDKDLASRAHKILPAESSKTKLGVFAKPDDAKLPAGVADGEDPLDEEFDRDFISAKNKITDALELAAESIEEVKDIAQQSQHPKAYEVLNQYIKNVSAISKDLIELYKMKNEIRASKIKAKTGGDGNTVQNNLFVGSTKELAEALKALKQSGK